MTRIPAVLAIAASLTASSALAQGGPTPWVRVTAEADKVTAHVEGGVDIDASPEVVWRTMLDCAAAAKMITNLKTCRIVSGSITSGSDVREHVTARNVIFPGMRIVFRSDYTPYSRITFRLVEGDLKTEEGVWTLAPLNGGKGTRVTYENRLAAASAFAPAVLVRQALRKDTPNALAALKREAEAAAKAR